MGLSVYFLTTFLTKFGAGKINPSETFRSDNQIVLSCSLPSERLSMAAAITKNMMTVWVMYEKSSKFVFLPMQYNVLFSLAADDIMKYVDLFPLFMLNVQWLVQIMMLPH